MDVIIVLPSLNPDEKLNAVVDGLLSEGFGRIVVVNDGSDEAHLEPFRLAAAHPEVVLLTHEVNRGKGRAMKTAFAYILEHCPDAAGVVTVDGDNQHRPRDVRACARRMAEEDQVILGCRDFSADNVPWKSRTGNRLTSFVFRTLCGLKISDTQTGLRAIPARYLPLMCQVEGERYEYETEMLFALKREKIPFAEERIETVYLEDNASSHFHPFRDSVKIYRMIAKELGRRWGERPFVPFLLSSAASFLVDYALFTLLDCLIGAGAPRWARLALAIFPARAASALFNYTVNRVLVFRSQVPVKDSAARYFILCVAQVAASYGLMFLLSSLLRAGTGLETGMKPLVDVFLFLISYQIQRRFVFRRKKPVRDQET